jgi:citrate lyase beta subunit
MATTLSVQQVNGAIARVASPPAVEASMMLAQTPVQVLYGGAHLFRAESPAKLGTLALNAFETWGGHAQSFGETVGLSDRALARVLHERVRAKLASLPIEAMCIDFEDGFGARPDAEEDAEAVRAATELATVPVESSPRVGLRIKPLSGPTAARAIRTLDLFVTTLAAKTQRMLRPHLTVTLPKPTRTTEIATLVELLAALEGALFVPRGAIGIELMVETPRALVDDQGALALPALVNAAAGRCTALHLGAYDLTAGLGVTAADQRLDHPACDLARSLMSLSFAGTNIALFDGATTTLPIAAKEKSHSENLAAIHAAWGLHATAVRRALASGIYAGWDLHPAQLPARYGALFAFFISQQRALADRLRTFVEHATHATRIGQIFDDAATGQGLLNFFLRGFTCGALTMEDVAHTGLVPSEIELRSFARIVAARADRTILETP